jgi:hypothetical protein
LPDNYLTLNLEIKVSNALPLDGEVRLTPEAAINSARNTV